VSLHGQCRRLQSESSFQEVFATYERQIQQLTDESAELRASNAALQLKHNHVSSPLPHTGFPSLYHPALTPRLVSRAPPQVSLKAAGAAGSSLVAVEARNQRAAVKKLLVSNEALAGELAELRRKDRQFELHRRGNEDSLRKVNSLARCSIPPPSFHLSR
jgi:hypothetical protein